MSDELTQLCNLITRYHLDWRHPQELRRLLKKIERGRLGPAQARRWLKKVQPWVERQIIEGNYLPKAPTAEELGLDEDPVDLPLGHAVEQPDVALGVQVRKGVHHVLIVGKSGAGKSVTFRQYFKNIDAFNHCHPELKILCVIFDLKHDIPNPELLVTDDCMHITVRDPSKARWAVNGPLNVPSSAWAASVSTILGARLGLIVSRSCLSTVYNWLLPILNRSSLPGGAVHTPSLRLILEVLVNSPADCWGEKIDYIRTLVQQLSALLVDSNGLFDADRGFEVNEDALAKDKHCIVDIADFGPPYLRYLIYELAMTQLTSYRVSNHLKTNRTEFCVGCEEGDFVVPPEAQKAYGDSLSPDATSARLLREYGVELVIAASVAHRIDPYLVASMDAVIGHCSVDPESIRYLQKMLMLPPGCEGLLPTLKPGRCIYRDAASQFPHPILGQIDLLEPDHTPKSKPYDSIPFTKATGLDDHPEVQQALEERIREKTKTRLRQSQARVSSAGLGRNERTLLAHMCLNEYEPISRLFMRMGTVSPPIQQKTIEGLVSPGLIQAAQIRAGKSPLRLGYPTKDGWEYAKAQPRFKPLRGDLIHTHICRWKQAFDLKRKCDTSICEFPYPGSHGYSDVGTKIGDALHCTEVVVGCSQNVLHHARDCFINAGLNVQTLTIVTLLKSEWGAIQRELLSDSEIARFADLIMFLTVTDIFQVVYP
jgi:hypothetical protein